MLRACVCVCVCGAASRHRIRLCMHSAAAADLVGARLSYPRKHRITGRATGMFSNDHLLPSYRRRKCIPGSRCACHCVCVCESQGKARVV